MDVSRQIKQGISTGELVFGQRETISACARGDADRAARPIGIRRYPFGNFYRANPHAASARRRRQRVAAILREQAHAEHVR